MKYSTIEIRPLPKFCEDRWEVKYDPTDDAERVSQKKYIPNGGLGFFHFPKKWGVEKAFRVLKEEMIRVREDHGKSLQSDINDIKNIKLPDWAKD